MQANVALRAAVGFLLLAAAIAAPRPAATAQDLPLTGTVDAEGADAWAAANPGGEIIGPSIVNEYLGPIPSSEDPYAAAIGESCNSCNGGGAMTARGFYNRCGCDTPLFPWITGPGNCDNWCVGPHWNVELDGMFLHRENAGWGDLATTSHEVIDEFDYGPGVRLFATGYNYSNYGMQIGYEGVNDFRSRAVIDGDEVAYESTLNSLEINLLRRRAVPSKLFAGFRYVEIDESLIATDTLTTPTADSEGTFVENRLMGFQIGVQRDAWQLNRWVTIEPFANVGAYFNDFKREDIDFDAATSTPSSAKREYTEMAYLGEAGITSVLRINACLALRGGYQAMWFHGVSNAIDTSLAANNGFDPDQLLFHGARFGIEYQR
jgi:hypothetical protein